MRIIIFIMALLASSILSAQTKLVSLNGIVRDTADRAGLHNAVIYLKDPVKSKLITFTRADSAGRFEIKNLPTDTIIMVVTYPGYVDWIDSIVPGSKYMNVSLITQAKLLTEVMVTAPKTLIRIKGDTTEYLADYFQMRPDATVEDMLRILPGMSVNAKGQITVHGQRVDRVLVDGEEFFGDDPTMATQNLNKNDISKVQVYDRKSDRAINTGVDDGIRQKTINLVLKEDAKKGYFGELYGGSDFNKYYQGKATISHFTHKLKAGVLLLADRTGRSVAGFEEGDDFGLARSGDEGIPESIQAAAMLNKKFGPLQSSTVNNAAYNRLSVIGNSFTNIKYILPDTVFYNRQSSTNNSNAWQQVINSKNEFKIDSLTTVTVHARLGFGKNSNASTQTGQYLASDNSTLINESEQSNSLAGDNITGKGDVYFKRLLNKTGNHFLIINAGFQDHENTSEGFLFNKTTFHASGTGNSQIVDQKKINAYHANTAQGLISYVTPLRKNISLNINYTLNREHTDQNIESYEKQNGKYDSLNRLFSSNSRYTSTSHRGGTDLSYSGARSNFNLGFALQDIRMKQHDFYTDSTMSRNFINIFPTARFQWKFSTSGNLDFNYNGRTQQPTFAQLQPILNNNDPLNIQVGNPALRPAFYHSFNMQLREYKAVTGRAISAGAFLSLANNDFNTASQIDNEGRRIFQTINVDGNYSYRGWLTYGRNLKFLNLSFAIQPSISGDQYNNFINGIRNTTKVFAFTPTLWINSRIDKKLDIQSTYTMEFRHTSSSVNRNMPTNYKLYSIFLYVEYTPASGWILSSVYSYNIREKLSANDKNTNAMIWHVTVEKKILPKENISALIRVNDILNEKIGFNRAITSTSITENTFMTVQRYILFALRWRFNKNRN
jgi:hypothetical protein